MQAALDEGFGPAIVWRLAEMFLERHGGAIADAIEQALPGLYVGPDDEGDDEEAEEAIFKALSDAVSRCDLDFDNEGMWPEDIREALGEIDYIRAQAPERLLKLKANETLLHHWREAYRNSEEGKKQRRADRRWERRCELQAQRVATQGS